jgi:glycosyltransferase involved in cell wall biosynthesis
LKILLILPTPDFPGVTGDSLHIYNLCRGWTDCGHSAHIVTLGLKGKQSVVEQEGRFFIHRLPFTISPFNELTPNSIKSIFKLPFVLLASFFFSIYLMYVENFDLIFVKYRPPFSHVSLIINMLTRKPIITKIAGTAAFTKVPSQVTANKYLNLPFEGILFKILINRSNFVISDNSYMEKFLQGMVPESKVVNIPPPVSLNFFDIEEKEKQEGRPFVVLYMSSFRKDEDVIKFILACSIVAKKIPEISFRLLGDGVTKSVAVELSKRLKLASNLSFVDQVAHHEIPSILANSDLLVALYVPEYNAIPLKILEYAAARKPIITTKNVATAFENEIGNFRDTCFFYPVELDAKSVADAITKLYSDSALRDVLAKNAYEMVANNFSLDTISSKYIKVFKETVLTKES